MFNTVMLAVLPFILVFLQERRGQGSSEKAAKTRIKKNKQPGGYPTGRMLNKGTTASAYGISFINSNTNTTSNFIGTNNNMALDFKVYNLRKEQNMDMTKIIEFFVRIFF